MPRVAGEQLEQLEPRERAPRKERVLDLEVSKPGAGDCDRTRYLRDGKLVCQLRECKCGAVSLEGSAAPCASCERCGSTIAPSPDEHGEPVPHEYTLRDKDGAPRCAYCGQLEGKQ